MKVLNKLIKEATCRYTIFGAASSEINIAGIAYDTQDVLDGFLFFALPGTHTDGHRFIEKAISLGAKAICCERLPEELSSEICYIQVDSTRQALSYFSSAFYDHPERELKVVGVTGTDGKSSTVYFLKQILESAGEKVGYFSTVSFETGDIAEANHLRASTPEAPLIHSALRKMVSAGKTVAVLEATSHALSPKNSRLAAISFDVGVFTNITLEHLEFHKTFENYRDCKANLVRKLRPIKNSGYVYNRDDKSYDFFRKTFPEVPCRSYSISQKAYLMASAISCDLTGATFHLLENGEDLGAVHLPLIGTFNIENTLAALCGVSLLLQKPVAELTTGISSLKAPEGRMMQIKTRLPFFPIVDYAHTPASFKKLFPFIKENHDGPLTVVFGSAGERDLEKRPIQGRIAGEYCDKIILTDEDPRKEDPAIIMRDISAGIEGKTEGADLFLIPNREKAISFAIETARPGEAILFLGKGHEGCIFTAQGTIDWNEASMVEKYLRQREPLES